MYTIDKIFNKLKCRTCDNLSYWDGCFCKKSLHEKKDEKLSLRPLKECSGYKERIGSNWEFCKVQNRCVFHCNECEGYINNKETIGH